MLLFNFYCVDINYVFFSKHFPIQMYYQFVHMSFLLPHVLGTYVYPKEIIKACSTIDSLVKNWAR